MYECRDGWQNIIPPASPTNGEWRHKCQKKCHITAITITNCTETCGLREINCLHEISQYRRNPGHERRTFPDSRRMSWRQCGGRDEWTLKQCSVNACVGDCATARQHAAGWSPALSASDDESWSVSPCYARTVPRHSSSPKDADCNAHTHT